MTGRSQSRRTKPIREPVPPDGGYGWIILFACFVVSFIVDGCMYSFGLIQPKIRDHYGASQETANLLTSLNTGFLFISGPIVTGLSNQFGIRAVVMGGATVSAFMYVLCAYSTSIYIMMAAYGVIGGISMGCTYISSLIIVAKYFDKLKGVTTGITMSGSGFGSFAMAPVTTFLINMFDWKVTLVVLGGMILQCCVMGALLRPVPTRLKTKENAVGQRPEHDALNDNIVTFSGSMVSLKKYENDENEDVSCFKKFLNITLNIIKEIIDIRLLFQSIPFFIITVSNFFIFLGYFIPFIYMPIRAKEINVDNIDWIFSIIGIVNIPSRLIFGSIADRKYLSAINFNNIAVAIAVLSLWLFPFLKTFWGLVIFGALYATGIGGLNVLCTPYLNEIVGQTGFTKAMGIVSLFRGLACFLGPFIGGIISTYFKSSLQAFFFSAICYSIGLFLSVVLGIGNKFELFRKKNSDRRYNSV